MSFFEMFLLVHDAQYVHVAMNESAGRFIPRTAQVKVSPSAVLRSRKSGFGDQDSKIRN